MKIMGFMVLGLFLTVITGTACAEFMPLRVVPVQTRQLQSPSKTSSQTFKVPPSADSPENSSGLAVKQGETVQLRFAQPQDALPLRTAKGLDKTIRLFPDTDQGMLIGLLPVSVRQTPGNYTITFMDSTGQPRFKTMVTILDAHFPRQNITVSKATKSLEPLPGEMEAIGALKNRIFDTRYWQEPFFSPTPDCENGLFGVLRYHNGVYSGNYHKGVDLRSPTSRPVHATTGGIVQIAKMYRLHGGTVGLDHGQGVSSIYIHMSKLAVQPGQTVQAGDVIGYVGATGFATGPHLHWGLYVNGLPVNPDQWVSKVPRCL